MATITLTRPTRAIGNLWTVRTGTAQANTGQTDWIAVPAWAKSATIWLNVTAAAGNTPLTDFKLMTVDPSLTADTTAQDFAGWNGITQIAGTTSGSVVIYAGAGITGIADDDTAVIYALNAPLPSLLGFRTTLDRTSADETYTYSIRVQWNRA